MKACNGEKSRAVGVEVGKPDQMQRQPVVNGGFAIGPGGIELDAVNVGQQVNAKRRIAKLHHVFAKLEILGC